MPDPAASSPIEIFRAGRHQAMSGEVLAFSHADLDAAARAYDPALHEAPLVVGHPETDKPAYGWVGTLSFGEGSLTANASQLDPGFAELVRAGRFKKISAAFYRPSSPANPVPGVYYLRHVGFLGAEPPAVKGLKPVAFADGDQDIVVFADFDRGVVRLLRGLRELLLAHFGAEEADRTLPAATLDDLADQAVTIPTQPHPDPEDDNSMTQPNFAERESALDAREKKLAEQEAAISRRDAEFAETAAAGRRAGHDIFLDGLVQGGRVLPAQKNVLLAALCHLDGAQPLSFSEGAVEKKQPLSAAFRELLAALPPQVAFGEAAPSEMGSAPVPGIHVPRGYAVDPDRAELHAKALQYQERHSGVDYITAVHAVGGR